jgi:tetratricopeptide (TPR) repeat protein
MEYIDLALVFEPYFRGAILQKGLLHLQLSETDEAEKWFKKAYDMSPDDEQIDVLYNIANSCYFLQKYPEIIRWSKRIVKEYPDEQMEALYLIATAYFYMFDFDSCKKYLAQIYKLGNNSFDQEYLKDERFQYMFSFIVQSKSNPNEQ